ncbi:hypothetical protein AMTRI_Chr09g13170 [Amborella trichopoda]
MRRINHVLSLLVGILITQMPPIAQAGTDFVWDLDGRPLRTSSQYYILPAPNQKIGSGLILEGRNGSCPFNVAVSTRVSPGLPIIFSPAGASDKVIRLSADQNIRLISSCHNLCPVNRLEARRLRRGNRQTIRDNRWRDRESRFLDRE